MNKTMKKFLVMLSILIVGITCLILGACKSDKVKISFETNGGNAISSVEVSKGKDYELPTPEKDGFVFEGWYDNEDLTGDVVTTVKAKSNAKYYAKWAELFSITLDTKGGTISQSTSSLKLKDGANLYEFLLDYVPVKTDWKFDCWMNNTTPVTPNTKITSSVTLTARYKVKYTVEIYKESLNGSTYQKDSEVIVGYDYVGTKVTPEISPDDTVGFKAVANSNEVVTLELTDVPANNLFKLYYDRETYSITFRGNYPDGSNAVIKTAQVRYGNKVELPADIQFDGYCLAGWATSSSGEVEYEVDAIGENLYNRTGKLEPATFMPERDMGLYAVWKKGYTDMFGGDDVVFLLDETSGDIYLNRGGIFFKGEYSDGEFSFRDGRNRVNGKLYPDGTFSYFNLDNDMKVLTLYRYGEGLVDSVTAILDGYNGITYRSFGTSDLFSSKGTYTIDDNGYYIAEFTSGSLNGQTLTLLVTTATIANTKYDVFLVQDFEKYGSGVYFCATYSSSGNLTYYYNSSNVASSYYTMVFTGFGNAYRFEGTGFVNYSCIFEGDTMTFSSSKKDTVCKLIKINGVDCYLPYNATYDIVATNGSDSLTLDGYGNATWSKGGVKTTGTYTTGTTAFGKFTVNFFVSGTANAVFIVDSREVAGEDDTTTVVYSYTEKPVGYTQYNFADASGVYNGVYVLLNDEFTTDGTKSASVYAKIDNNFIKISSGTYELVGGLYVYDVDTFEIPEGMQSPFGDDIPDMMVLTVVDVPVMMGLTLPALVCLEYTVEDTPVSSAVEYTATDGAKLSLINLGNVGKVAIYEDKDGNKTVGTYSLSSSTNILTVTVGSANRYYKLENSDNSFESLLYAPYTIYRLTDQLTTDRTAYITFNGKGRVELPEATYTVVDGDDTTTVSGTVRENNDGTYTFVSTDESVQITYKLFESSSSQAFAIYDDTYAGRYVSEYGTLELDGYGYRADLTTVDGTFYGRYTADEDGLIVIYASERTFYVDVVIGASRSFSVRGREYNTYFIYDNAYMNGVMLDMDGYGNLKAYTLVEDDGKQVPQYIDENGTYDIVGDVITIHYDDKDVAGVIRYMQYSSTGYIPLFVVLKDEVVGTYVSTSDWAVLVLDGSGMAVKYSGSNGTKEEGYYVLITDTLLYYYNKDGDDACVYEYDAATGVATANNYTARGYYTSTLESLVFTKYGYAIFNGETRYYYFIESDNSVTVYRRPNEGETGANAYNFIKVKNFCKYGDESIEFEDKTYSLSDGFAISFNRQADNAELYPVPIKVGNETEHHPMEALSFTPAGSTEFTVSGIVMIDGNRYGCYVIREMVDGQLETYIRMPLGSYSGNYFRFDIDIVYGGVGEDGKSNSIYTVKSMTRIIEYDSFIYQYNYLLYNALASMMGYPFEIDLENTIGSIAIRFDYNTEGEEGETYIDTSFGSASEIYDADGELMQPKHLAYEYESQLYVCELNHTDGYTYRFRFGIQSMQSIVGYILVSATRVQTLTDGEYTAEVEMLLASETYSNLGEVLTVSLKKGEEDIEMTNGISNEDGSIYYINRTKDEGGKITATDYYKITLTKSEVDEDSKAYPVFTGISIEKLESVETVYGEDGKTYADIDTVNNEVYYFYVYNADKKTGASYVPYTCEYSDEDDVYTVTLYNGRVFTIKVVAGEDDADDTVVITEVELPAEDEETEDEGTEND